MLHQILKEIENERKKQDEIWGEQNHGTFFWLTVLMEEVGEASKAALEANIYMNPNNRAIFFKEYRQELIQVAAVAVAAIESLERNELGDKGGKSD